MNGVADLLQVEPAPNADMLPDFVHPGVEGRTYTWRCRNSRCTSPTWARRHDKVKAAWDEHVGDPRRVVKLVLGRDI